MKTAGKTLLGGLAGALCLAAGVVSTLAQGYPPYSGYPAYPSQPPPSPAYPPQPGTPPAGPGPVAQPVRNPLCAQLEGQLVALDRGATDPARADQIRRYEDAANKQQYELDRVIAQSRRMGCQGLGFFSLFSGQAPQCGQINQQIQQMRSNLDGLMQNLAALQNNTADREGQRQSILLSLAQNDCGPQYRSAAAQPRGFFETLFGPGSILNPRSPYPDQSSTYSTVCVRSCDGYYFPISYATTPDRFGSDEQRCQRLCPGAEAHLYSFHNTGEDIQQAVSLNGQPYVQSPNAFHYRQKVEQSCSCRRPGQSWADALKSFEDPTLQSGDIVVTDENAKQLAQPKGGAKTQATPSAAPQGATAAAPVSPAGGAVDSRTGKRKVRTVGPVFFPNQ